MSDQGLEKSERVVSSELAQDAKFLARKLVELQEELSRKELEIEELRDSIQKTPISNKFDGFGKEELELDDDLNIQITEKSIPKIHVKPAVFSGGKSENIRAWIFQFEQCMNLNNISSNYWQTISFMYFSGTASTWYLSRFRKSSPMSWNDYKKQLMAAFEPFDVETKVRLQIRKCKQNNSLDDYVNEIRMLLLQLDSMAERDKIECFLNGLKENTKKWVRFLRPTTLEESIGYAISYDRSYYGEAIEVNEKVGKKKFKNSSSASFKNDNATTSNNRTAGKVKSNIICYACGETGHYKSKCPNRKKKETMKVNSINLEREDCFFVDAMLDGRRAKILIDTGASSNLVSSAFVTDYSKLTKTGQSVTVSLGIKGNDKVEQKVTTK
jgi:hypothetical protein